MAPLAFLATLALAQVAMQPTVEPVPGALEAPAEPAQADQPVAEPLPEDRQALADEPRSYPPSSYVQQSSGDRRIQMLTYDPDTIVTLSVSPGFASVIELNEDERAENVVVGNSAGWQVTANRRGDRVIVKPLGGAGQSNLIVMTGSRRYVFVLDPFGDTFFVTRFLYPRRIEAPLAAPSVAETGYRFRGNKGLFPLAMSDNGRRTIIRWGAQNALPAIFAMNDGRTERLVSGRIVGEDIVIEGAAVRYKFRYGKAEATAFRAPPKAKR